MKQIGETGVLETKLPNDASSNLKRLSSVNHPFFTKARFNLDVTVPHRQKGSALSSLRFAQGQALSEAKDLSAERDRPFASLRVTRWDGCNCEGLFFTTEPCLNAIRAGILVLLSPCGKPRYENKA